MRVRGGFEVGDKGLQGVLEPGQGAAGLHPVEFTEPREAWIFLVY